MSTYITLKPAPHVVEAMARRAMSHALNVINEAMHIDSNYTINMHPKSKVEWQALIGMAHEELDYGLIQRRFIKSGSFFVTEIYITADDASRESLRCINLFDWQER